MISLQNRTKLHLGCGKRNFGKDWIHIDAVHYPHIESVLLCPLDIPNNSMDLVYASHVINYFDRDFISRILTEWVRVLKPGGILRLAVPDFFEITRLYPKYPIETFLGPIFGKMPGGSKTIYHKTAYDFISLKRLMESVGLIGVDRYDWRKTCHAQFDDHSQAYIPHMDKENGQLISLNVQGVKI